MLDSWLVSLDNQIVATLNALGTSQDRLDVLTEDVDALIAQEPGYTADVSTLENRVSRTQLDSPYQDTGEQGNDKAMTPLP